MFITREAFEEEHGFPVAKYNVYKALVGDLSDNIKGVEGFGPAKATLAIKTNSVAEDIWEMCGETGHDEFKLALSLVNLNTKISGIKPIKQSSNIVFTNLIIYEIFKTTL